MNMELNEHQKMLKSSAREFCAEEVPLAKVRAILDSETGISSDLWNKMSNLGWLGIMIPEKYGGCGGAFLDMIVLLVEMGRAYVPSPYLPTMVLGAIPLLDYGTEKQKKLYLPGIAKGESIFSMAIVEEDGRYSPESVRTSLTQEGSALVLTGTKLFVPYGEAAQHLICVAKNEFSRDICLVIVDTNHPGVHVEAMNTMTQEFYAEVTFDHVRLKPSSVLTRFDDWTGAELLLGKAAVARCAQAVGLAEHILQVTVEYAKKRVQFGKPIGSFQAIQHYCANMLLELDGCRLLTYEASWRISEGLPYAMEAAMTKAWCSQSFKKLVALAHQVHGGVGFILDHELPLYYRNAWSTGAIFGDSDHHYENIAKELVESADSFSRYVFESGVTCAREKRL